MFVFLLGGGGGHGGKGSEITIINYFKPTLMMIFFLGGGGGRGGIVGSAIMNFSKVVCAKP